MVTLDAWVGGIVVALLIAVGLLAIWFGHYFNSGFSPAAIGPLFLLYAILLGMAIVGVSMFLDTQGGDE